MSVEKKYLHDIDLVNNKLINPLLNPLTTAQRTAVGTLLTVLDQGYVCFDTTQNIQYFWNGSTWVTVTATTSWGSITGTVTAQTDLTAYLAANYYPLSSNPAGYLTTETDPVFTAWLATPPNISIFNNDSGYLDQTAADLLYYPLSSNPAGYLTSSSISGMVTGSGTLNYIPKWTPTGAAIGNSQIFDDGLGVMVNTTTNNSYKFDVNGSGRVQTNLVVGPQNTILADTNIGIRINTPMTCVNSSQYNGGAGPVAGSAFGVQSIGEVQSDITVRAAYFRSNAITAAASFTLQNLHHFFATQQSIGAGSIVTNQYGFFASSNISGATNNYGFYGDIAAATNNWNLYMNGTAKNYLAGNTLIGGTTDAGFKLDVTGTFRTSGQNTLSNLAGSGTRMVVASSTGLLSTQTIPTGTVTSVTATSPITSSGGTAPVISTSMATNKLIGRSSAGTGVMEEITVGTGLSLSGGTLNATAAGILHGTASGTDTYTVTIAGATAYADGDAYLIRFPNGNTTGATLNINGLGAVTLYRNNDGPVIGGDIWNGAEMLCIYNSTTGGFQLIGTSPNAMYAYITNDDSVTITKGQVVYAFGGTGDRMTVKLANNVADATSAQTVGVVLSTSIAANQKGVIITQGLLDGLSILPTATYADGDPLFLGATPGSVTNVKPYAPNHLVYLGNVTTASNGAAGRWYVRVQNGYELDELHNVQAQSPSVNDVLYYFGGSPGQWKTASISSVLGYTPVGPDDTDYEYLMMSSFRNTYNY